MNDTQQAIHMYGLYERRYMQGLGHKPLDPYKIEKAYNEIGFIDFHSWLVHKKTREIFDPTPQSVPELEAVYKQFPRKIQRRLLARNKKEVTECNKAIIRKDGFLPRRCIANCLVYAEQNTDYKIVYGHQGFIMNEGYTFWEFG